MPCRAKAAGELKKLQLDSAELENAQLGTVQLLSPVRTHKKLETALGAARHQVREMHCIHAHLARHLFN